MKTINLTHGVEIATKDGEFEKAFEVELAKPTYATWTLYNAFKAEVNELTVVCGLRSQELKTLAEQAPETTDEPQEEQPKEITGKEFIDMLTMAGNKFDSTKLFETFEKICDAGLVKVEGKVELNRLLRKKLDIEDFVLLVGEYAAGFFMNNK